MRIKRPLRKKKTIKTLKKTGIKTLKAGKGAGMLRGTRGGLMGVAPTAPPAGGGQTTSPARPNPKKKPKAR
jgi:hypothetical protein